MAGRFVYPGHEQRVTSMQSITVQQRREREGTPLIDVREEHEYAAGHVPGAVNLPMSTIGSRLDELPAEPFDVICQVGGRSGRVVEALAARGYDATNIDGGTAEWIAAGYPVES